MGKTGPIFGLGAIGFGSLLLWSAYTGQPVFGANGALRMFVTTGGDLDGNAFKLGQIAGKAVADGAKQFVGSSAPLPPNNPPPGAVYKEA